MLKIFGHYIPRALLLLYLSEIFILLVSISLAILITFSFVYHDPFIRSQPLEVYIVVLFFTLIMHLAMISVGLYQRDLPSDPITLFLRILLSFILGILLLKLLSTLLPLGFFNFYVQGLALSCAFIGILSTRLILRKQTENIPGHYRALVIGTGDKARQLESRLAKAKRSAELLYRTDTDITGYVDIPSGNDSYRVDENKLIRLCGKTLCQYARENDIMEVIVAMDDRRKRIPFDELIECRMHGINVIDMTNFLERETGSIILESFLPSSFFYSEGFMQMIWFKTKRLLDICVSLFILIITSPITLITALAIWYESGGKDPVIYRQERIGLHGMPFYLLKFRSMVVDAEKEGAAVWAQENDARVTRVGRIIRRTRIDELPQLVNIFKGDMSLVGPRPERPQIVEALAKEIPFYNLRHYAQPGITGWAQICYPYGASTEDAKQKLQYDLYYIKNYSVFLDMLILLQTTAVVLWGKGAR